MTSQQQVTPFNNNTKGRRQGAFILVLTPMNRYFFLLLFIFFLLPLFSSGIKEARRTALTENWGDAFVSHPASTQRDCIPSNSQLFFCSFSGVYSDKETERKVQTKEFIRQLNEYQGIHVKGELLDYMQGNTFFSKWYDVSMNVVSSVIIPDSWHFVSSVSDTKGSVAQFSVPGKINLDKHLLHSLRGSSKASDFFKLMINQGKYRLAVGIALQHDSRKDSWLASDKAALLELARSQDLMMIVKSENISYDGDRVGSESINGSLIRVDTVVQGFYILYRWFDHQYFYSVAICDNR